MIKWGKKDFLTQDRQKNNIWQAVGKGKPS